jgi:hypothetical protein
MRIPLKFFHVDPISFQKTKHSNKGRRSRHHLFKDMKMTQKGVAVCLVFIVEGSVGRSVRIDLPKAKAAFLDPDVQHLLGSHGCGHHPMGRDDHTLSYEQLVEYLLPRPALSIVDIGHIVAHCLQPLFQALFVGGIKDSQQIRIVDRVGLDPRHPDNLVIGYYIEPGSVESLSNVRTLKLRTEAYLRFVESLLDGQVDINGLKEGLAAVMAAEKAVRRVSIPFPRPATQEVEPDDPRVLVTAS